MKRLPLSVLLLLFFVFLAWTVSIRQAVLFAVGIVNFVKNGGERVVGAVAEVHAQGIEHVLNNIGAGDKMSRVEIESIVSEMGACPIAIGGELGGEGSGCIISADQMLDLMSKNWAEHHHDLNQ